MKIGATCDVLLGMQEKAKLLEFLDRELGPHLLTPIVSKLHERRLKFAGFIVNHMRVVEQAEFKDTDHLVKLTKLVVQRHFDYLRQNDRETVTQTLYHFFGELREKPEVKDALYELGFKSFLDELQDAHNAYMMTYVERRDHQSSQHKGSTLPVQREIQNILKILFDQVDHYQHVFSDVDYSTFITELNSVITNYTKQIKTRDTQRKNKKLKAQEKTEATLEEKVEMEKKEKMEENASTTITNSSVDGATTDIQETQKNKPSEIQSKINGSGKPINGHMDNLKKPDKTVTEENEDGESPK